MDCSISASLHSRIQGGWQGWARWVGGVSAVGSAAGACVPAPLGCCNQPPAALLLSAPRWALSAGFARWKIPLVPRAARRKPWLGEREEGNARAATHLPRAAGRARAPDKSSRGLRDAGDVWGGSQGSRAVGVVAQRVVLLEWGIKARRWTGLGGGCGCVPSESSWPDGQCIRVPTATCQVTVSTAALAVPCFHAGGGGWGGSGTRPFSAGGEAPPCAGSRARCLGWGLADYPGTLGI